MPLGVAQFGRHVTAPSKLRIDDREDAVVRQETTDGRLVRGFRGKAEHDLPPLAGKQIVQGPMHVWTVRAQVNPANLPFQKIDVRRKDDDLRLLNIGLE